MCFLGSNMLDIESNKEITHGSNVSVCSPFQQHRVYSISNSFYKKFSSMFSIYNEDELLNVQLLTLDL